MTEKDKLNIQQLLDDDLEEQEIQSQQQPIHFDLTLLDGSQRLDRVLASHLKQYSRSRIQKWIEQGHVLVNGKTANSKQNVIGDESVDVWVQQSAEETSFSPEAVDFAVVYEDDDLIVINKPAGLVVHPAAGNWSGTLLNGLLYRWPNAATLPRAGIVHRLDKDTSGLMVVARSLACQTDLVRQLQARTVRREYMALVWGDAPDGGMIDEPIGRHPRERVKMAVLQTASAKPAITHFRCLAKGNCNGNIVSLVKCRLQTGRTHQIRVHMQHIGLPLVGDPLYGKSHLAGVFHRQALHAFRLGLVHPGTGENCQWQSNLPQDMAQLIDNASINMEEQWYETDYA